MVGRTIAHYRVTKVLGHGGMGEVYLADDLRLKRQVALKFLTGAVGDATQLERFEREAQVVATLNHPNIVTVHAIERDGESLFIAMEYLDGRTLADSIPPGGLPLSRLLPIATQVVDAIVAAHGHGIVHRDLKPSNVMVLAGDRIKVLDFGLAKLRESPEASNLPTRELTGEGRIVGTLAYMSPEQAEGKSIDDRSDIFALGVMLYEMATGQRPFKGDTSLSLLSSILRDTPRPITEVNPGLPRDISRIVRHALAKDPDRRYQTAKDLRNDLDDLTQSISSGELTAPSAIAPRSPWPIRLALTVALLAVAAVVVWRWRDSGATMNDSPPALSHTRLTQREGIERSPSISPDGKWVAYQSGGDIFLQSVTGQTAINLTPDSPAIDTTPAFSPDGETIAFRSSRDGGGIFLMGRTGESVKRLTNGGFHPAWFPDGKTIVYASGEAPPGPENRTAYSELWTVPVDGGEPRLLHGGDAVQPRVSPNGKRIAYWDIPSRPATRQIGTGDVPANRDLWTIGADGRDPVRVAGHEANDWNPVWSPDGRWLYFLSNRSGSMGLWRVAIDESSGVTRGDPQPLATPAWYVGDFSLSADGTAAAYASFVATNNVARQRLDPRSARALGDLEMLTTGTNDFVYLDPTRDGRFIALTTSSRTREDLYVLNVADGSLRRLTNDFARDRWPRWDRDGRSIYFYSDRRGYQIWRIDADGSGLRELTKQPGLNQMYPSLSPDGARLAASDQDLRQLVLYDTRDFSKPLQVATAAVEPKAGALQVHDWAPDGRSFLLLALDPERLGRPPGLWSFTFETGSSRRIADCAGPAWMADGRRLVCNREGKWVVVDAHSGTSTDMGAAPRTPSSGGARLAVDDSQLFFLQGSISADIWVARFAPATRQ